MGRAVVDDVALIAGGRAGACACAGGQRDKRGAGENRERGHAMKADVHRPPRFAVLPDGMSGEPKGTASTTPRGLATIGFSVSSAPTASMMHSSAARSESCLLVASAARAVLRLSATVAPHFASVCACGTAAWAASGNRARNATKTQRMQTPRRPNSGSATRIILVGWEFENRHQTTAMAFEPRGFGHAPLPPSPLGRRQRFCGNAPRHPPSRRMSQATCCSCTKTDPVFGQASHGKPLVIEVSTPQGRKNPPSGPD